jgi:hypothetical protein
MTKTSAIYEMVDPDTGQHLGFRCYSKGWSWRRAPPADASEAAPPIDPGETPTCRMSASVVNAASEEVISPAAPPAAEHSLDRPPPYGLRFGLDDPQPQGDPNSPASIMWQLAARSARMGRSTT